MTVRISRKGPEKATQNEWTTKDMCRESNAGNHVPVRVSTKRSESRSNAFSLLCDTAAENHPVTVQAAMAKWQQAIRW